MNFTSLDLRGSVEGYCLIKTIEVKTSTKGDEYLDMTLADSTGEINAKLWRYLRELHGEYEPNQIIKIRGVISPYNGVDQLKIDRIRHTGPDDNINASDFVKTADYTGEDMYNELLSIAESFSDEELKAIVCEIYKDMRQALLYWPAAFKLHHAIRGGLLLHTLSIVRLAQKISEIYTFVDKDLLIAGAMLHDIAKIKEYDVSETGVASGYTQEGNLLGHLAMGAMVIDKYAEKLGTSNKLKMLLEHMSLSHHGEPEFGASVRPMFLEAELLSELDLMDSRVYEMVEALKETKEDDFSSKVWAMDNRKLFNHARVDLNNKTKLF